MSGCKSCNQSRNEMCWNCGKSQESGEAFMRVTSDHPKHNGVVNRWFCSTCYRGLAFGYGLPDIHNVNSVIGDDEQALLSKFG